jgi:hypothetical protein
VRPLILLLLLACVILIVLLTSGLLRRAAADSPRDLGAARWVAVNVGEGGRTTVSVRLTTPRGRVLEERRVTDVDDQDPDYEAVLLEAMAKARSRATVLNLELRTAS